MTHYNPILSRLTSSLNVRLKRGIRKWLRIMHFYSIQLYKRARVIHIVVFIVVILLCLPWLIGPSNEYEYFVKEFENDTAIHYPQNEEHKKPNFLLSHPFDNTCHFPTLLTEDATIDLFVNHSNNIQCPPATYEHLVSQSRDGEFLIGSPSNSEITKYELECYYRVLGGALFPSVAKYAFVGDWIRLPINRRFTLDRMQFVIECWSNVTHQLLYRNAFMNVPFKQNVPDSSDRYSITILEIDSTSRNQFFRHMPNTLQFMHENEFQILRGYTKVGDNSAINTMSLLAGRVFEAKYRGIHKLMAKKHQLTPNQTFSNIFKHVKMVFDDMKKDGCQVLWNDDIGGTQGGLFHYQAFDGFRVPPTDYYFRPYYTYIYKNLNSFSTCINGEFLIPKWLNIWERFSTMYKQKCHFSFNHLSYFTHSNGNNLELYDSHLSDALTRMKHNGVFNNTVIIIMGDHGQRINPIKYSYYGKVEERMPFASIHLPEKFRRSHPKLYTQLIENTNRFTSTFDLYETLKDLTRMKYTNETTPTRTRRTKKRIGRSLFDKIPKNRNCTDAKVPDNFCVCMNEFEDPMNITNLESQALSHINEYLHNKLDISPCLKEWRLLRSTRLIVYAVTSLLRYGPRHMDEWWLRISLNPAKVKVLREIVEVEQNVTISVRFNNDDYSKYAVEESTIDIAFRFQHNRVNQTSLMMLTDGWIFNAPCKIFQIDQLCTVCVINSKLATYPINKSGFNVTV